MTNSSVVQILLVGLGGFIGSILRFLVSGWVHTGMPFSTFPYGTLVVNVLGCLGIGLLGGLSEMRQALDPAQRVFLLIGVLGGFTTFSSFAYETLSLTRDAEVARAFANVLAQTTLGLGAAWIGYTLARFI